MICQDCQAEIELAKIERLQSKGIAAKYCELCSGRRIKNRKARRARHTRESALRDCGLVKVRGALGGTYWE